jgi:hypothetical protein
LRFLIRDRAEGSFPVNLLRLVPEALRAAVYRPAQGGRRIRRRDLVASLSTREVA